MKIAFIIAQKEICLIEFNNIYMLFKNKYMLLNKYVV